MTIATGRSGIKALLLAFTALTGAAGGFAQPVLAQDTTDAAQKTYTFNIPAQSLSRTLTSIASTSGLQVFFPEDGGASGATAPAIRGRMTAEQALAQATAGTGFIYRYARPGVITLVKAPVGNDGEQLAGVVQVEGLEGSPYFGRAGQAAGVNGINGSRDITATEGTKSFTSGALTIGSKVPQALKDVPQSISVLTNERLAQQNVTDFTTAMKQLPGITLVQGSSSLQSDFYSRGFLVTSIQVDGGAPLVTRLVGGAASGFYPQIDMSIYDHIELLRGAEGQFAAYGDPSGTVNLVRKKPLDHAQYSIEAQAGSWQKYRIVADASSPIAFGGKLRGRLVMTYQDNHHFYETAKDNKKLVYGIAELDVSPTTLLTAGVNYARQDSVPWQNGLPRYLNGDDLQLPRSTCLCFGWDRWDFDTTEIFGGLEQKIGDDWTAKLNLTRTRQTSTSKIGYSIGAVNPTNGLGPQVFGNYNDYASTQLSAEATLAGAFTLFGQRQEVTIGVNRANSGGGGRLDYQSLINTAFVPYRPYPGGPVYCNDFGYGGCPVGAIPTNPPIDVFNFDQSNSIYNEPASPIPTQRYTENGQVQTGAYINLRLTAFNRLHLTTGLHWSRYESDYAYEYLCTMVFTVDYGEPSFCFGKHIGDAYESGSRRYRGNNFSWPPPVSLSFDLTKALTAYVGYTDIYRSQANYLDSDLNPLSPITGANWEGGLKWAARDGKLNLSIAAYRIQQKGSARDDPNSSTNYVETPPGSGTYCCFVGDPNRIYQSQGIDFEATGELGSGWQISASYNYSETTDKGSSFGTDEGASFLTIQPKHLYKLWTSYDFGAAGHSGLLSGLTLSGGVNGQSSAFYQGNTCIRFTGTPNQYSGAQECAPNTDPANPSRADYRFTVPAQALLSARIDYRLSAAWALAVNLENILDKTYYQTTSSGVDSGHWYGAPRSFTATLRAKW